MVDVSAAISKRILIIDDEFDICELLQTLLCLEGFDVTTVSTAEDAMHALAGQPWDLVLLDVVMPQFDGWAFAQFTRDINPKLPVIFMTAKIDEERYCDAVESGLIQGRLYKPFGLEDLQQMMTLSA